MVNNNLIDELPIYKYLKIRQKEVQLTLCKNDGEDVHQQIDQKHHCIQPIRTPFV